MGSTQTPVDGPSEATQGDRPPEAARPVLFDQDVVDPAPRDRRSPRAARSPGRGTLWLGAAVLCVVVLVVAAVATAELAGDDGDPDPAPTSQAGGNEAGPGGPGSAGVSSTLPDVTRTTVPPGTATGEPITLAFAGDVNYESPSRDALLADPASRLRPVEPILAGADLAIVNLETAITERGAPVNKEFTFRAPPSVLDGLAANGVDVVSMANNHGLDFGSEGLLDSIAAKRAAPIAVIGIGSDEDEAFAPHIAEVKGQRVAVITATQVLDSSLVEAWTATEDKAGLASAKRVDRLVEEVERARILADTVVVFLHWGMERETCPTDDQQKLALRLVAAGADVIVGAHAHRVLGGGRMGQAVVHYGLGNFAFFSASPEAATTGVFTVTARGRRIDEYRWQPGVIRDRVPFLLEGEAALTATDAWNGLRECTALAE